MAKVLRKVLCLTTVLFLFTAAFAEDGIFIRQRISDVEPGGTLFSAGDQRAFYMPISAPYGIITGKAAPVFVRIPLQDGVSMQRFSYSFAFFWDEARRIRYHYTISANPDETVESYREENPDADLLLYDSDVLACILPPDDSAGDTSRCVMEVDDSGEKAMLWIDMEYFGLDPQMSESERREMISQAVRDEVALLRQGVEVVSMAPYWNADAYSGVELIDDGRQCKVQFDLPAPTRDIDGDLRRGAVILESLDSGSMSFYACFDPGHTIVYGVSFAPKPSGDVPYESVTLDNGNEWSFHATEKDGGIRSLQLYREIPGATFDGAPLCLGIVIRQLNFEPWRDRAACLEELATLDGCVRFVGVDEEGSAPVDADGTWFCPECGSENTGKFCPDCGTPKPEAAEWECPGCGSVNTGNFCPQCGAARP